MLQAGDCAESFAEFTADSIRDKLRVILQMAVVLTYGAGVPVVKVGRIAGQFAKPRTSETEAVAGRELPTFRGHMINGDEPTAEARVPDPDRMLRAYHQSASTLNLLRAFTRGGFADLTQVHSWNQQFVAASEQGRRYDAIAAEIDRALDSWRPAGSTWQARRISTRSSSSPLTKRSCSSYEEALTRRDSLTGDWYDCSAHMVWVGERTRQLEGAHVEFLVGHLQPDRRQDRTRRLTRRRRIAVRKAGSRTRSPGRLTLITRMGASQVTSLPPADPRGRAPVGATGGLGVRPDARQHFRLRRWPQDQTIRRHPRRAQEASSRLHRQVGTWPGGVHVELTGDDVTECLGGEGDVTEAQLGQRYTTACDPRLNARQSIDLAFRLAELLRSLTAVFATFSPLPCTPLSPRRDIKVREKPD